MAATQSYTSGVAVPLVSIGITFSCYMVVPCARDICGNLVAVFQLICFLSPINPLLTNQSTHNRLMELNSVVTFYTCFLHVDSFTNCSIFLLYCLRFMPCFFFSLPPAHCVWSMQAIVYFAVEVDFYEVFVRSVSRGFVIVHHTFCLL